MLEYVKRGIIEGTTEDLKDYIKGYVTLKTLETVEELEDDIERIEEKRDRLKAFYENLKDWGKGGWWSKGIVCISSGLLGFGTGYKLRNKKPKQAAING